MDFGYTNRELLDQGYIYVGVTARHKQRMALIEKGMDPGLLRTQDLPMRGLRNGMFMVAIGIGLIIGRATEQWFYHQPGEDNPLPYFVAMLICGGVALIAHHVIAERTRKGSPSA